MMKTILAAVCLSAALGIASIAQADYPDKPIRIILPFAPGQGTDVATRIVMAEVQKRLGQPVIIENRPGGSGMIAIQAVMKAPADGYTVLGFSSSFLSNSGLYKQLPYDLNRDFIPVIRTVTSAVVLAVHPSFPVNTVAELVEYVKRHPGELSYASGGNSTTMHLSGELLKSRSGVDITHIPYKGDPAAITDVLGGQVKVVFSGFAAALPHIRAGKLKPIAVTTPARIDSLPNVPTIAESGYPGYELVGWLGYMVPAGTPPKIVDQLAATIRDVIDQKPIRDHLADLGMIVSPPQSPAEFKQYVEKSGRQITDVIRSANIHAE